ncbi:MAG: flippase [Chitinispirillaceae bacterium]|nr:flippase [Chitinispirillaceae bacterium]
MRNNVELFLRDTGWSLASLMVTAALQFVLRAFLANYFGPEDLGLYTLAFTVYALGLVFSGFGINSGMVKYIAENKADNLNIKRFVSGGVTFSLIIGSMLGLILFLSAQPIADYFFNMPELAILIKIVSFAFPFIAIEKAVLGFLNGLRRMRLFSVINIFQSMLVIILTIIFAVKGYEIEYAVIGLTVPVILVGTASLFFIRKQVSLSLFFKSIPVSRILMSFGLFVVLANAMGTIMTYASSTIIGYFMNESDVGVYSIAVLFVQVITLPPSAIQTITSPTIAGYWANNNTENIESLVNTCMKYTAIYAIMISFVIFFMNREFIQLLFKEEFLPAAEALRILLPGAVFGAIQTSVGGALSSTAYVNRIFLLSGLGVIVSIITNSILVAHFGITGAAIATSITTTVSALILIYFTRRLIGIKLDWLWFVKLFGLTASIGAATFGLSRVMNISICIFLGLLLLALLIIKLMIPDEDKKYIYGLIHIRL